MTPEELEKFRAAHDAAAEQAEKDGEVAELYEAAIAQIVADRKAGRL
jgi:hypothetical protein